MPTTMFRIMVKGLGPALQIAEGHFLDLPKKFIPCSKSTN
jgi:hypothetical protein